MEVSKSSGEEGLGRHAHWLLRIALLGVFTYHGIDKFMGGGIAEFATIMGLPWLIGLLVALTEIAAGVLVVAGGLTNTWITRLGALLVVPVMFGAIAMEHWGQWHFMATPTHPLGGMQFQFTLLMVAFYLLIRGNAR
ncbi:MAG: DoxX family protein [Ectothiorhodospiraceae bacterium]|nr:DoxX family protein [Ectothiorhodospiraceae bacterium]